MGRFRAWSAACSCRCRGRWQRPTRSPIWRRWICAGWLRSSAPWEESGRIGACIWRRTVVAARTTAGSDCREGQWRTRNAIARSSGAETRGHSLEVHVGILQGARWSSGRRPFSPIFFAAQEMAKRYTNRSDSDDDWVGVLAQGTEGLNRRPRTRCGFMAGYCWLMRTASPPYPCRVRVRRMAIVRISVSARILFTRRRRFAMRSWSSSDPPAFGWR